MYQVFLLSLCNSRSSYPRAHLNQCHLNKGIFMVNYRCVLIHAFKETVKEGRPPCSSTCAK